jgi:GntR family transcriptional regulator
LRLLDGDPVALAQDWIEAALVPGLLDLDWQQNNRSLYSELRTRFGLVPDRGATVLSARLALKDEADLLELERRAAVLTVEQIAYSSSGRPINATLSVHHPTRYPLRLEQSGR